MDNFIGCTIDQIQNIALYTDCLFNNLNLIKTNLNRQIAFVLQERYGILIPDEYLFIYNPVNINIDATHVFKLPGGPRSLIFIKNGLSIDIYLSTAIKGFIWSSDHRELIYKIFIMRINSENRDQDYLSYCNPSLISNMFYNCNNSNKQTRLPEFSDNHNNSGSDANSGDTIGDDTVLVENDYLFRSDKFLRGNCNVENVNSSSSLTVNSSNPLIFKYQGKKTSRTHFAMEPISKCFDETSIDLGKKALCFGSKNGATPDSKNGATPELKALMLQEIKEKLNTSNFGLKKTVKNSRI